PAVPLSTLDVDGSAAYLLWSPGERLATIATHDLYSGEVEPRARFSPPSVEPDDRTQVATLGGDLALVLGSGAGSFVAVAPASGAPFGWMRGVEVAWEAPVSLLIRDADGRISRWSSTSRSIADALPGTWSALLQTPTGAALRRGDSLSLAGKRTALTVPHGARVLAVSPDFRRVLIAKGDLSIWDGKTATPLRVQGYKAVAA